jgi:hypothetical protein
VTARDPVTESEAVHVVVTASKVELGFSVLRVGFIADGLEEEDRRRGRACHLSLGRCWRGGEERSQR